MLKDKIFSISLPQNKDRVSSVNTSGSLLFVGANGSGKTRLGAWIEFDSPQKDKVHRISAQKSLSMPDSSTLKSIDLAESDLLYGNDNAKRGSNLRGRKSISLSEIHNMIREDNNAIEVKRSRRWRQNPAISFLDDYQQLMVYLLSDHAEECAKYRAESIVTTEHLPPSPTKLDTVKKIWEKILPHRELILGALRIQTRVRENQEKVYNSSEMSDGERVIFYLIGQCLAAPENGIIVIDEPELHLHKSVQAPLWSEIEKSRPDCLFVYLTHDVDFAAAQQGAKRIWLKSFDGRIWDWEEINADSHLPDELILEVLGSRKPVVFVEGENGKCDTAFYREVLPNFLVIPKGSCTQVIQSVKALKANEQLHHLDIYGIIDLDRRVPQEIETLEKNSIFVLKVAEVENLFYTKGILNIVSNRSGRDAEEDFQNVSNKLFSGLQEELENQVSLRVSSEIKFRLNNFDDKTKGKELLLAQFQLLTSSIDIGILYDKTLADFQDVLSTRNYEELLALYNRKSLYTRISESLGLAKNSLPEHIINLLIRGNCRDEIIKAVKKYFGNFESKM